jgi:hypothetical protein
MRVSIRSNTRLGAISPSQSAASASTDAAIAVCFAPEEDCAAFVVRAIDTAEREILVAAYRLTVGSGIVGALIRAKERGVDVRVIADKAAPCGRASGIDPLAAAGVPVWIDDRARIAHAKTIVVDGAVTLQGSYNWTRAAAANSEISTSSPLQPSRRLMPATGGSAWGSRFRLFSERAGAEFRQQRRADALGAARFPIPTGAGAT